MSNFGMCINANNAIPSPSEFGALGLGAFGLATGDWVRTPIQGSVRLLDRLRPNLPTGMRVLVDGNNECEEVRGDWSGWEDFCQIIANEYSDIVKIVGCGNELDLWRDRGDRSLTPDFAASLVRRASPILRAAGVKVATCGVASGDWQAYLEKLVSLCRDEVDYANLHLYVKSVAGVPNGADPNIWQTVSAAWARARLLTGLPVLCSEAGIKVDDAGGLEAQAQWATGLYRWAGTLSEDVCPVIAYFAWSDGIGTADEQGGQAFGARDPNGKRKPVWYALQGAYGGPVDMPAPIPPAEWKYELGFAEWHQAEPELLGDPDEAREHGGITGFSQIRTKNGIATWADLRTGEVYTFFHDASRKRYRWQRGWARSVEM